MPHRLISVFGAGNDAYSLTTLDPHSGSFPKNFLIVFKRLIYFTDPFLRSFENAHPSQIRNLPRIFVSIENVGSVCNRRVNKNGLN